MQNLRDKLLKAGKVSKKQKRQADHNARKKRQRKGRSQGHLQAQEAEAQRQAIYEAKLAEQRARDQAIEAERRKEREARERLLRIKHIIDYYSVPLRRGPRTWCFMDRDGLIRRMQVRPADAWRIERGQLAIVQLPDTGPDDDVSDAFAVVPRDTALDLWGIDPDTVRFFNRDDAEHPPRWFELSAEAHTRLWEPPQADDADTGAAPEADATPSDAQDAAPSEDATA